MKNILFVVLLAGMGLCFTAEVQSQSLVADTIFNFNYFDAVNGMILTESGEAILVGKMATDSLTPKNIWVRRLGFQNDTIVVVVWEKFFFPQNSSRVSAVEWTQDGNFVIAGSWNNSNMLLKMSPEGDSLTTLLLPGTADTHFKDVAELANGDFFLLQVDVDEELYTKMLRITSSGDVVWDMEYWDRYYSSLEFFNDDSMMAAGFEIHQTYQHILFSAYAPNGNSYFKNIYQDNYGFNYSMVSDSGAIYLGNSKSWLTSPGSVSQVVRMHPSGDLEWEVDFSGIGSDVIKDIHVYDNYLLTCSERVNAGQVVVGAITFDGVLASTFVIPKQNPYAVAVDTWENFLYITGRQFNGINGRDIFFMKFNLDSLFVISGQPEYVINKPLKIFPNPADDMVRIQLNNHSGDAIRAIRVYNAAGRLEREINVKGATEYQLQVKDLPGGLYILVVHFNGRAPVSEKILLFH